MDQSRDTRNRALERAMVARSGVARRKDLVAVGFTSWDLAQGQTAELISKVAPGYYALPSAAPVDVWLAQHQSRRTCLSKVADLGLWLLTEPSQIHVAAAHGNQIPGCVVHRAKGRLTLMDVLRQCVKCGSELEALVVLESAVVKKKCTVAELRREFVRRQDSAGRSIVAMIDPQSMSIAETCGRYHLTRAGYNVQGQAFIRGAGHLDLLVDGVLGIETDGEKYHNDSKQWKEDLRKDTMYVLEGIWRLRIPAAVVMYQPELMLSWIKQALAVIAAK